MSDTCTVKKSGDIKPCDAFRHVESDTDKGLMFEQLESRGKITIAPVIKGEGRSWARVKYCPFCGVEYAREETA